MTALAADAGTTGSAPAATPPEERGRLTVAERVVERVAGYAATQVDGAAAAPAARHLRRRCPRGR